MLRAIGVFFLLLCALVLASDWAGAGAEGFRLSALGEWWFWASPSTIQLAQPAIERHVSPALWAYGVQPLLLWPLAVELFVLGVIFLLLALARRRRRNSPR